MMRKRLALLTLVGLLGLGTGATAPALAQDRVAQEETTNNEDEGGRTGVGSVCSDSSASGDSCGETRVRRNRSKRRSLSPE